ncbi:MAG: glycosyltransferase [Gemmatimonadaceae bacterium]
MRELTGLRICFVAGTLGQGGAERQLYYMLRALKDNGAVPRVLSLTRGEYWEDRIRALGIPVTWVGQTHSRLQRLRAIIREVQREPAEILQSQHFYTNIYVAAAARFLGIREIGALRSDAINEVGANSGPLGWLSLRAPRAIAANSKQAIENAVRLGMTRSRLNFLPNVVDTSQFAPGMRRSRQRIRVLTIGRIVPQKRLDRFLRTVAAVQKCVPGRVQGVLVGDGPARASLESGVLESGMAPESVEFHGLQSDVADFYHNADVFLLTSDWEGTPNVVLEAMASGLPVVATRVGGVSALIRHGETGYLVDPENEASLADAVRDLIEDREKRIQFGDRARRFVEQQHALPALAAELRQLYNRVLSAENVFVPSSIEGASIRDERLLVVTSVVHYQYAGRLWAYGPYAMEIDHWAKIFPQLVIAAPKRNETPPADCLPIDASVGISPQPEVGGAGLRAKLALLVMLPHSILRLGAAMLRADAIHVRCPGNLGLLGVVMSPLFRRKRVAKFAGQWSEFEGEAWTVRLQRQILRSGWWRAPVMVYTDKTNEPAHVLPFFTSALSASQMTKARGASISRANTRPLNVLFAGRLSAAKNVHTLLDAIAKIRHHDLPMTCTIVGEGPQRMLLEQRAETLGIRDYVRFAGGMTHDDVLGCYEVADILVLASETEGWPKTLTEAMAFGLICIGSNRGLVPNILAEGRGFTVTPGDSTALADVLRFATQMSNEALREMRSRATAWAGSFTSEHFKEALEKLLEDHWGSTTSRDARAGQLNPSRVGVMHLTDTLEIGGAERMAVSLANSLSRLRFEPHLCTTRRVGPLADMVAPDVGRLSLNRRRTLDASALRELVRYNQRHNIKILHAHGTAVFVAAVAALFRPHPKIVWHIHYGRHAADLSSGWQYRAIKKHIGWSIAVSEALADWAVKTIGMPSNSVTYIPNFSSYARKDPRGLNASNTTELPGQQGARIVCVANLVPEKDHITLVDAMERVIRVHPSAHLLLVGGGRNTECGRAVAERIANTKIAQNVSMLGQRRDVAEILLQADIGVLSSRVEGLPLALIEYGEAGLPVVVTSVGQCADVVDQGRAGIAVRAGNSAELADGIAALLRSADRRAELGSALRERVRREFNADNCVDRIDATYEKLLAESHMTAKASQSRYQQLAHT